MQLFQFRLKLKALVNNIVTPGMLLCFYYAYQRVSRWQESKKQKAPVADQGALYFTLPVEYLIFYNHSFDLRNSTSP